MKTFNNKELIISKPEKIKPIHKLSEITLTMAFWFMVFYLWQPLISLVAWSFGFNWYYQHMITLGGSEHLFATLTLYLQVVFVLGSVLILWAFSNKIRFKNKTRRGHATKVAPKQIAEQFKVNTAIHNSLLKASNVSLLITDEFNITAKINHF